MPSRHAVVSGLIGVVLIGLTGCATAPASREADPAFARQNVAYATHEPPGTIVIDPASFIWCRVAAKRFAMELALAPKVSSGRAGRPFTPNRNGRTGIRQPRCCRGSQRSESTWCNCKAALE